MARPRRDTVDYFPHNVNHGKTIYSLENQFGNDGYAAWFKILELLGRSPGHYYEIKTKADLHFLSAVLKVSGEKTRDILGFLAELEAIDRELYKKDIIWSENLVNNLKVVYSKRNSNLPEKPGFRTENHDSGDNTPPITDLPERIDSETPQSKVKERKVKTSLMSDEPSDDLSHPNSKPGREEIRIASYIAEAILKNDPGYRFLVNGKREATIGRWAGDIEKIHRLDGRPWEQIESVVSWCMKDPFWSRNILSGEKLRTQFDQLVVKMPTAGDARTGQNGYPEYLMGAI